MLSQIQSLFEATLDGLKVFIWCLYNWVIRSIGQIGQSEAITRSTNGAEDKDNEGSCDTTASNLKSASPENYVRLRTSCDTFGADLEGFEHPDCLRVCYFLHSVYTLLHAKCKLFTSELIERKFSTTHVIRY